MPTEPELFELTRAFLTRWPAPTRLDAILKGGSDREFYRVQFESPTPSGVILMVYTLARPDNPRFVPATHRLESLKVQVPRIYAHDTENLCVWLEDLGHVDLHSFREQPWEIRRPLYESTLREVAKLHGVDADALPAEDVAEMELCFDERLYEWEQNYFLTHYFQGMQGRDASGAEWESAQDALKTLRLHLAGLPRGLVHRDFQSQNVLIRDGSAWLIDYQGVRPGLAEYDLASLLLDPYVALSVEERDELLAWYAGHTGRDLETLRQNYFLCAAQRLMQAVGAYANLSRNLGKPHFEEHIPVALERLREVCASHPMLAPVTALAS
ncbi:MAG TPA: phosphotransferase [Verrucomicrobium sp.]|nr:phosphotransferase [Verrucomicrobium sp.]